MARIISKFGKSVRLEVVDESGKLIFDTTGLRVDFEVKVLPSANRAKFTIYNLAPDTIKQVSTGQRFIRLFVRLHDREEQILKYDFYVNNSLTVKQVPNSLTELYCIGVISRNFTSKDVQIQIKTPTLRRYCESLARAVNKDIKFKYVDFPKDLIDLVPISPNAVWSGTVLGALEKLGKQYTFTINEGPNNLITLLYLPLKENQKDTEQNVRLPYKLKTVHMRSNPKIGVVEMNIESNLDFNIKSGVILDTTELVAISAGESFDFLTLTKNSIVSPMEGNAKYVVLTVEHKGSNYTGDWVTTARAAKPKGGTRIGTC